jgi:predicted permease
MRDLVRDLRRALRTLARTPLFAAVAVVTLALGIGVNATLFTVVDAVLLRPLPVEKPGELAHVYTSWSEERFATSSYPDYRDLRDGTEAFAGLIGHSSAIATLQLGERSEMLIGELVTGNAFEVLGVGAARGRMLSPADDADPGAPRVVVLGHGLWQRRFGRDAGVLGRSICLNGQPYEVVGIAPERFAGLLPGIAADFWVPAVRVGEIEPAGQIGAVAGDPGRTRLERRGYRWLWVKGRLAGGGDLEQAAVRAQGETAAVMARLAAEYPLTNAGRGAVVRPASEVRLHPDIDRVLGPAAAVLLGAVGLVLLVVCANLASMLLARAEARRKEVAVRLALGAGRLRLAREVLVESLVVAAAGALLALVATRWTLALLLAVKPPIPFSIGLDLGVDGRVLLFTAGIALASALAFGLLPARRAARGDLASDLRGLAAADRGARLLSLRSVLVVAQVAVTLVFLVAAALLGRGLLAARSFDPGFAPERVAAVGLHLNMHGYGRQEATRFFATLRDQAEALPGIAAAAVATRVPFDVNLHNASIYPDSVEAAAGDPGFNLDVTWVDDQYFETLGVPLLTGRGFTSGDRPDSPRVAIVNAAMARRFWGGPGEALGRRFAEGAADAAPYEIVGVVADYTVRAVGEAPRAMVHFARGQEPDAYGYLLARTAGADATALAGELRRLALSLDPELAFTETTTLAGLMGVTLYPARMGAALLGVFGLLALTLASVGLYGVIAFSVSQRRREVGVRLALGARRAAVVGMVVRGGMALVGTGVVLGLALAAAASRLLAALLYGVAALDPVAFGSAVAVLAAVALAANYLPAARAARTDPVAVLKEE